MLAKSAVQRRSCEGKVRKRTHGAAPCGVNHGYSVCEQKGSKQPQKLNLLDAVLGVPAGRVQASVANIARACDGEEKYDKPADRLQDASGEHRAERLLVHVAGEKRRLRVQNSVRHVCRRSRSSNAVWVGAWKTCGGAVLLAAAKCVESAKGCLSVAERNSSGTATPRTIAKQPRRHHFQQKTATKEEIEERREERLSSKKIYIIYNKTPFFPLLLVQMGNDSTQKGLECNNFEFRI